MLLAKNVSSIGIVSGLAILFVGLPSTTNVSASDAVQKPTLEMRSPKVPVHVRRKLAINRLTIQPGDIIDIREIGTCVRHGGIRALFRDLPPGAQPPIEVIPPAGLD
jgi:hypothetical protein